MSFLQKHRQGVLLTAGVVVSLGLVYGLLASIGAVSMSSRLSDNGMDTVGIGGSVSMPPGSPTGTPPSYGEADYDMGSDGSKVSDEYMPYPIPPEEPSAGSNAAEVDARIIKNGSLHLTVDDVSASTDRISSIATTAKGFVQSTSTSERADGKRDGYITVRVPADAFESTMSAIKGLAKIVNNESSTGEDVTEQYSDLEARLRNAQAQETEYLRILTRATSVEDILAVQAQLGNIRGQIESYQGRLKYLENVTSYSTISVTLTEEPVVQLPTKEFRPGTIVRQAVNALIVLGQDLVAAIIWIVIVGGGLAIPVLLLAWIVRALLRARRGVK